MAKESYTKQDCIEALRQAYDELGHSPKANEYRELDISPTYSVFYDKFGSWNEAKEAAGLEVYPNHMQMSSVPELLDISEEEWKDKSARQRYRLRTWAKLSKEKIRRGCYKCGYDEHPSSLDFHHTDPEQKELNISQHDNINEQKVMQEVEKCKVVCSNCHREIECDIPLVDLSELDP